MLLIADSGSTKTDWRLVDEEGNTIDAVQCKGLNPYFLTETEIAQIIKKEVAPITNGVEKVIFYGAGCGLPEKVDQVKNAIESVLPIKYPTEVYGDILGAARSLLQGQQGITCILGTGANSCVYDGHGIIDNVPSLGYILADWGSGTVLCKDLISLILQEKIDAEIREDFHATYPMDLRQMLDKIYNKPQANRFLASFTPFLLKYAHHKACEKILKDNFRKFFEYYVLAYDEKPLSKAITFTGSIAYHFSDFLHSTAAEYGLAINKIVQHPMNGLVKYHCQTVPAIK
ncbi:N-acetylglucosamine kinase [Echinicola strongylocentroti]|uniref:N-acetylglucosamine kinase n=1 Tax=Echinicola strongylocentroti TaxID=1795355 RepID=A0A2Z4IL60_9BACT|nr:BadF/BadG/BcrA/BcrD ATPase family protein [Echinicola strongylocentroti]AWW31469.1 N-acetylglucosamine kinase [Echinicola strongylocentroti]